MNYGPLFVSTVLVLPQFSMQYFVENVVHTVPVAFVVGTAFVCFENLSNITTLNWFSVTVICNEPKSPIVRNFRALAGRICCAYLFLIFARQFFVPNRQLLSML